METTHPEVSRMELNTEYLGLTLSHPIVASASPMTDSEDNIRRMEDAGAAAVVMHSLFEEQIRQETAAIDRLLTTGEESFGEALSYFPPLTDYRASEDRYLEILAAASSAIDIPLVASLNGVTAEGWTGHATAMEQAGASAIELNIYYIAADAAESGQQVESRYLEIIRAVKGAVSVPVAVKVGPFFSAFAHMAQQMVGAGADGLVLFNRFYQPNFDLEQMAVTRTLELSRAEEIRAGLLWISVLYRKLGASIAASTGVEGPAEVIKYLMAGADVVMTTSSLLRHGIGHLGSLRKGLGDWMDRHGFDSLEPLRGSMSLSRVANPSAFERANYIRMLEEFEPA